MGLKCSDVIRCGRSKGVSIRPSKQLISEIDHSNLAHIERKEENCFQSLHDHRSNFFNLINWKEEA